MSEPSPEAVVAAFEKLERDAVTTAHNEFKKLLERIDATIKNVDAALPKRKTASVPGFTGGIRPTLDAYLEPARQWRNAVESTVQSLEQIKTGMDAPVE